MTDGEGTVTLKVVLTVEVSGGSLLLALGPYSDIERLRAPEKIAEPGVLVAYLRTAYWPFLALQAGLWNQ